MREDLGVLVLGCGYAGTMLAQQLAFSGRPVYGTTRSRVHAEVIRSRGAEPIVLDALDAIGPSPILRLRGRVGAAVVCIPPGELPSAAAGIAASQAEAEAVDASTARIVSALRELPDLESVLYMSATSVWGDRGGERVDESTPVAPDSPRGEARVRAERAFLESGLPAQVIRPAGIYGPGRSQLHRLAAGEYRLVGDGGALTNRIHVLDLATLCAAALERGEPGSIWLASDLRPAPQREVALHVAVRYGLPAPPALSLAEARVRMSRDAFSMVTGSKRLDPSRTLERLGVTLRFPDYEAGLAAIWAQEAPDLLRIAAGATGGATAGATARATDVPA